MYAIKCGAWIRARIALLVLPMLFAVGASAQSGLVISQVYGGGGNVGAPYSYDFIELYNSTSSPISLNGLSVQYAAATGTSWSNLTVLPNVSVAPAHYFLVQEAEGTTVTNKPLPTPDATGSINLSATAGKVALVNGTTAIASGTSCPSGATIVDFVGFGTTANCFEGSGPASAPSNTTSVSRNSTNADTNNNAADFTAGAPNPRNSSFGGGGTGLSATGAANPSTVTSGGTTLLTVTVTPGTGSTGIAVTADLSGIGGSATQAFYDDGTNGDVTPGDNVYSFSTTATSGTSKTYSLPVSVTDTESGRRRRASALRSICRRRTWRSTRFKVRGH